MGERWAPGQPVTDASMITDIACALAFGQQDDCFVRIGALLVKRGCETVGEWRDWTTNEFFTMIKANSDVGMKKNRRAYLKGFESATGCDLGTRADTSEDILVAKPEKKATGGDMMGLSHKVSSNTFNVSKWQPDAIVYSGVPKARDIKYMSDEHERLYLDKLWLALQARSCPPGKNTLRVQHAHTQHG